MTPMSAQERVLEKSPGVVRRVRSLAAPRPRARHWVALPAAEWQRRARTRRVLNIAVALVLLVLLFPAMVVIAILVKLTSKGPVLFTQTRVGLDRRWLQSEEPQWRRNIDYGGRLFTIYKFRTMHVQAGWERDQVWAQPADPRVTPLGRILRGFRLDELPQLVNVLKGDMNLVGPRPEQPKIFVDMRGRIDAYERRQRVLPGITGWAQINHHYDSSVDDVRTKLSYDLDYVQRQSFWHDAAIMLKTVPVVIFRRGAW